MLTRRHAHRLSSLLQLLQQHIAPAGAELASKNRLVHQYAAEISGLQARLAPVQADADKKAARVAQLEALQADTRAQVRVSAGSIKALLRLL